MTRAEDGGGSSVSLIAAQELVRRPPFFFFFFFFLTGVNHGAADAKLQFTRWLASASAALACWRSHIKSGGGGVITFPPRSGVWASAPAPPPHEPAVWGRRSNLNSANTAARLLSPPLPCFKRPTCNCADKESARNFLSVGENPEES